MANIEKMVYHNEVFSFVANNLKEDNIETEYLMRILRGASDAIGNYERDAIFAFYNNPNNQTLIDLSKGIVHDVTNFVLNEDRHYYQMFTFKNTVSTITSTLKKYNRDFINDNDIDNMYYRFLEMSGQNMDFFDEEDDDIDAPVRTTRARPLTPRVSFMIINNVIHSLVKDINNIDIEWEKVNRHYRNKYRLQIDIMETGNIPIDSIEGRPIIFLSYAFLDRAYTYYLFKHFYHNGAFLYVNDLFNTDHGGDAYAIKESLHPWIKNSNQFLFLRSVNSQRGQVRPWCSWEIGNFFSQPNKEAFKIEIFGAPSKIDNIIGDFKDFSYVTGGVIY